MDFKDKTFLLTGNSRSLLDTTFSLNPSINIDYFCKFGWRWMPYQDNLKQHTGDFNLLIGNHYNHQHMIDNYQKYNMKQFTDTIILICPKETEKYHITKNPDINYIELTSNEYNTLQKYFTKYNFPNQYVPRTGLLMIVWLVFMKHSNVYIRGFDINATDSNANQDIAITNHKITSRHSSVAESNMLKTLLKQGYIKVYA